MVSRAVVPSAPPRDEGYGSGSSSSSTGGRGTVRPHSVSPILRSIRRRLEDEGNEEEVDLEAISCLLDFSTRERGEARPQTPSQSVVTISNFMVEGTSGTERSSVMVRTFANSPPATLAAAPRPERPPPVISDRRHSGHLVRPRPLRRSAQEEEEEELRRMSHTCHSCVRSGPLRRNAPPAAALGAPPAQEEEDREDIELPDLPETPASPATSDLTVIRLVKKILFLKRNNFLKIFFMLLMIFVYFLAPPARPLLFHWSQTRSTSANWNMSTPTRERVRFPLHTALL